MRADSGIARAFVIVVTVILIAAACQTVLETTVPNRGGSQRDQVRFEQDTSLRIERYVIPAGDGPVELCVRIALVAGSIGWQVRDPQAQQIKGHGQARESEPYRATYCFEATPGVWEFHADLKHASGQYEVAWRLLVPDSDATDHLLDLGDG